MTAAYDLIILGAGPAGLAASIYASRYKIKHLIVARELGGFASQAHLIENYPGQQKLSGQELMNKFIEQVQGLQTEILIDEVIDLKLLDSPRFFELKTINNKTIQARALIFALGTQRKKLNIPGEKEFWGRGVTYCATCDAPLYRNKIVAVVGGGDAALTSALLLAEYATKVYLIHRRDQYAAQPAWQEKVASNSKIEKILSNNVKEIRGEQQVKEIILENDWQGKKSLAVGGIFIEIGSVPAVELGQKIGLALDEKLYIKIDNSGQTNVAGLFAAGDITNYTPLKQILTAASQGAIAAQGAYKFLH